MDSSSLSHTSWNCKYHIVFAPKYRRKIIYGELNEDMLYDQMSMKEYIDPFTGEPVIKSNKKK